jgi:hypothetical protein
VQCLLEKANLIAAIHFDLLGAYWPNIAFNRSPPRTHKKGRLDIIRVEYSEDMKLTSFHFVFQTDMQL